MAVKNVIKVWRYNVHLRLAPNYREASQPCILVIWGWVTICNDCSSQVIHSHNPVWMSVVNATPCELLRNIRGVKFYHACCQEFVLCMCENLSTLLTTPSSVQLSSPPPRRNNVWLCLAPLTKTLISTDCNGILEMEHLWFNFREIDTLFIILAICLAIVKQQLNMCCKIPYFDCRGLRMFVG